ncbi:MULTISPECIES: chromate efflux transporter [unclassified Gordonia (in: high G+C Gram-positive bacteria)]|uniref:chromate efflux transporter n=1 Tax=unclassified Gordonia (in: high G+C Gram-positive bacteria) TaxID=2657482 RepID=UPI0010F9BAF8|nr:MULTISPECIES: chromate efflux transporter [unclassified Gordonia (in: high G+C Gram-positive bacteria)]
MAMSERSGRPGSSDASRRADGPPEAEGSAAVESGDHVDPTAGVSLRTATRAWFLISLQTFGGPAGQIAVMQRALVDDRRWIGQRRFLHALNYCMLLPGPEAQQLAIYVGWLLNGTAGGLIAGILFVLPGVIAILGLSAIYVAFGATTIVAALFAGIGPAVLAIVAQAVTRVSKRALTGPVQIAIAVAAFIALAVFAVPFPMVIAVAGVLGWLTGRRVVAAQKEVADDGPAPIIADDAIHTASPSWRRAGLVLGVGALAWIIPMGIVVATTGTGSVFTQQGTFFTWTALITFGGAYAVLAYIAQQAVEVYGWVTPGEMVRGLGLAETTPGPLIMVVQFVAFLGAYRDPGGLDPWVAATIGALLTTWVTFVPSFVFIFLGAPFIEKLRNNRHLTSALNGVTAAVVGVIANLALYFALHTLFRDTTVVTAGPLHLAVPHLDTLRPLAVVITVIAFVLIYPLKQSVLRTLGICAVLGLLAAAVGLPLT